MTHPFISVNQLAEFSKATSGRKDAIIRESQNPNTLKTFWYQLPKARIKKYFENIDEIQPVIDGIDELMKKITLSDRQKIDRKVSIEALQRVLHLKIPALLKSLDYEIYHPIEKSIVINGVEIKVAPEIIIKAKIDGKIVYGAVKIHICKSKPFNSNQANYVSVLVHKYLLNKVVGKNEIVIPELCFCYDVFGIGLVSSSHNRSGKLSEIKYLCMEINKRWNAA